MLKLGLSKNCNLIISSFFSYLPSRLLVVLNSLLIVPIFVHLLTSNEIGIFQLAIAILNLICTCSTDWITKSVLRFYHKYKICDQLDEFFSNTIIITILAYVLILLIFGVTSNYIENQFLISHKVLFLTLFLVIPVGLRQFLYQMLRVLNRPFLYTFSIVIYQLALLALYFLYSDFMPNVFAILTAMVTSIFLIDFYILKELKLKFNFYPRFNKEILYNSLKYALPQIITNSCIWSIYHANIFILQYKGLINDTAIVSATFLFIASIITPVLSSFLFSIFPNIVQKYEFKRSVKSILTNAIQLYCVFFIPIVMLFCLYPQTIRELAFQGKYPQASSLIVFFALTVFFHELMKIFNMKFHLRNRTYIEMSTGLIVGIISLTLNFILISKIGVIGIGIALLVSMLLLFGLNISLSSKDMDFIKYSAVLKTAATSVLICLLTFSFVKLLLVYDGITYLNIVKMLVYLSVSYIVSILILKHLVESED